MKKSQSRNKSWHSLISEVEHKTTFAVPSFLSAELGIRSRYLHCYPKPKSTHAKETASESSLQESKPNEQHTYIIPLMLIYIYIFEDQNLETQRTQWFPVTAD